MEPTATPRVKVCCITSEEEARLAVRLGASALGFVSDMPSGPGVIPEEAIARIVATVPPGVARFLLTCRQDAAGIVAQQRRVRTDTIQLCDSLAEGTYADLRAALPGIRLVQVIHVSGPESVDEALLAAPHADALLLDSGRPLAEVKELGGTGRRHDWSISRRIREAAPVPVFLAGGLTAENVGQAVAMVRPFSLDVCSGVRTGGALDATKLGDFLHAVAAA